jgi:FtsP/CotA-like multicopper oxidase with cupredoxin domain
VDLTSVVLMKRPRHRVGAIGSSVLVVLLASGLASGSVPRRQARLASVSATCPDSVGLALPTAPNFCADLIPTPDLQTSTGVIELGQVSTPFGVAVTRDGEPRYRLATRIDGLPAPSALGRYAAYVAWASTLSMDSTVKLGAVHNGETSLGNISWSQFRILISAESAATVRTRAGRLVLRGTSPDSRLLAHRDITQLFGLGHPSATGESAAQSHQAMAMMPGHATVSTMWAMPPTDAVAAPMPPMPDLQPSVRPFRAASATNPMALPPALPQQSMRLHSGDTLTLSATLVRRSIGGRTFSAYAYNGQVPGPLLEVSQGDTITVWVHNETDLPTTVHWHGVRLDNDYDGTDGVTQEAIPPAGTFMYHVRFPDAGVFWYHAHHREDIAQPLGLYGNILVRPAGARAPEKVPEQKVESRQRPNDEASLTVGAPDVNREDVLTIGDMLLDDSGPAPWGEEGPTHALMGRFGNVILVNGELRPRWTVRRGEVVRFYFTNVSTARPYNLSFGPARMKVIGSDGGRFEREASVSSLVIAPAERYTVDVRFPAAGEVVLTNRVRALSHMTGSQFPEVDTLATFGVSAERASPDRSASFDQLHADTTAMREIDRYRHLFARPVDHELRLIMSLHSLPLPISAILNALSVPVDWNDGLGMMNWVFTPHEVTWILRDGATGAENMNIDWHARQGDVVKLRIANDASAPHAMDHVIHLHGQRFLVLARNGTRATDLVWKDTVLIPAGETVDLLLDLANPGRWLLHCHIAEHMEASMMMSLTVDPRLPSHT